MAIPGSLRLLICIIITLAILKTGYPHEEKKKRLRRQEATQRSVRGVPKNTPESPTGRTSITQTEDSPHDTRTQLRGRPIATEVPAMGKQGRGRRKRGRSGAGGRVLSSGSGLGRRLRGGPACQTSRGPWHREKGGEGPVRAAPGLALTPRAAGIGAAGRGGPTSLCFLEEGEWAGW